MERRTAGKVRSDRRAERGEVAVAKLSTPAGIPIFPDGLDVDGHVSCLKQGLNNRVYGSAISGVLFEPSQNESLDPCSFASG